MIAFWYANEENAFMHEVVETDAPKPDEEMHEDDAYAADRKTLESAAVAPPMPVG